MESTSPGWQLWLLWHPPHLSHQEIGPGPGIVTGYPSLPPPRPGLISYLGRRQPSSGLATLMWVDIWGEGGGHRAGSSNENRHNHNQTLAEGRLIGATRGEGERA